MFGFLGTAFHKAAILLTASIAFISGFFWTKEIAIVSNTEVSRAVQEVFVESSSSTNLISENSASSIPAPLIKKSVDKTSSKKNANKFSFKVYGNCGMCEETIEEAALSVSGVKSAKWNKKTKKVEMEE